MSQSATSASLYAGFQSENPEGEFNNDLIYWREQDDIKGYLEDVFAALEVVPGITMLGVEVLTDESQFPDELRFNDIEVSRMDLALVRFRISVGKDEEEITLPLLLPKLVDSFFYVLNGSLYYPILQLVDRSTYITRSTYTLKTLLMPLVFRTDVHAEVLDLTTNETYAPMLFILDLFRSKINVLTYFFASAGLDATLKFLTTPAEGAEDDGIEDKIVLAANTDVENLDPEQWMALAIEDSEMVVAVSRDWLMSETQGQYALSLAATLADAMKGVPVEIAELDNRADDLDEEESARLQEFWMKRLGRHFTRNSASYVEKAEKILISLERILDRRTKKNLAQIPESDKDDVYAILRWMMRDFGELSKVDNMDLRTKRIRLSEYLIHPLLLRFSESTYRLLNSQTLTFGRIRQIFRNVGPGFVIRKLIMNDLLRYSGCVNQHDLFSTALRYTTRGPQSMGARGKGDLMLRFRGHHESYLGRVGLSAASASDPGASGTLVPFAPTDGQFFTEFDGKQEAA